MIKPAEEVTSLSSNNNIQNFYKAKFPIAFSLSLIVASVGIIILILFYFNRQKNNITADIKKDLAIITELKAKQIENWREERILDGSMISENRIMINSLISISKNKNNESLKENVIDLFKSVCERQKYLTVRLVDANGEMIISYPEDAKKVGKNGKMNIKAAYESGNVILSDFHFYEKTEKIHMDLVVPIKNESKSEPGIFLLLEVDPDVYLYPVILSWPEESKSGEAYLVEKSENDVLFLNNLRHIKNTALNLKINLSNKNKLCVKAVEGQKGYIEALDYRDVPVVAYNKQVLGTNWFVIAKIDNDEVYEDINRSSLSVTVLIVLIILTAGFAIFLYWSKQKEKYLKNLIDSDRKRMAIISHFDNIIKNANDIFILYDDNANVVEVNEKAMSVYGYTKEEFLKLNLNDLRAPDVRSDVMDTINYVKKHPEGLLFETRHIKKDGTIFPIESSTRYLQLADRYYFQSVVRDITERKQAEKALFESEQKFSTIFRSSPEGIALIHAKTNRIIDINETFSDKIGYKRDEIIGRSFNELGSNNNSNKRKAIFEKALELGFIHGEECDFISKSGETLNCMLSVIGVRIGGEPCLIATIVDITERKKSEEKIQYLNRIYALLSQINQAIVRIDNKKELLEKICNIAIEFGKFSFAWIGLLDEKNNKVVPVAFDGYENGYLEVVKNSIGNNVKTNPYLTKFFEEGINIVSNDISKDDFHVYDRDDAIKRGYKSSGLFPIRENGKVIGLLCLSSDKPDFFSTEEIRLLDEVTMDISFALDYYIKENQRKEINEALNKSERKFRALFDNAGDAILLLDDYKFIEFNKVAEQVYGLDRNELLFKSPSDLSPELQYDGIPSSEKAKRYMNDAYEGKLMKFEWLHKKINGELFETEVTLNSVYIGSKKMLLAIVRDISERKKYEKGLRIAKEKAEEMNRIKSNFLANMSHELRTPMTGILGFADILSASLKDPEHKEMAEVIYKGGKRLTNTLNMILDLSKIEAEKIDVNLAPTNLSEIAITSVKLFEAAAKSKNLTLECEVDENIFALVDGRLLEQVLSNLIKNAITYSNKGKISVNVDKKKFKDEEYAEIKVIDTGIGIPKESLEVIFEPFRQVSEGWTRNFEGTGLGLTISRKYVELMNGSISVNSELKKGSTFIVRFKAIQSGHKNTDKINLTEENKTDIIQENKKRILLVEDDELTVFTIKKVLGDVSELDITNSGLNSISMAEENDYDIILMDIGLKDMDGLEATKRIRKIPGYEKKPIVAITAYAMAGDREKFFNGGCSHYISKPFSNDFLKKTILDL